MSDKIFGYDWADIQRAQAGGRLAQMIDTSQPLTLPCKAHDGRHRYMLCTLCQHQYCPLLFASCPRCHGQPLNAPRPQVKP